MVSQFGTLPHYLPNSATDTYRKQNNPNYKGNCKTIGHMEIIGVDHIVAWMEYIINLRHKQYD